jgi:putative hydrolase of the HAD superfamily
MSQIKILGFDADDTLWINETYYRETEKAFTRLLENFAPQKKVMEMLYEKEINNIPLYGYGAKGFMLSMTETAVEISNRKVSAETIEKILDLGKALLNKPVVLLDGAREVLQHFKGRYRMILATKGDLLDQERKLRKSGLDSFFHHIEVMSDKKEENYARLLRRLNVKPDAFVMVGNSLKSDVLPVLKLGAWGVHVPYHTTWVHEETDEDPRQWKRFIKVNRISDLPGLSLLKE